MFYIYIENDKPNGCGQAQCLNEEIQNIEVSEQVYNAYAEDNLRYIWNGEEIIENPDYEQQARDREQERINNLTMTAQDLLDLISNSGASWDEIDNFLNSNKEFKLRLTTCQNVFCGVIRRLLPIKIGNLTITDEMIVMAFKRKNGEE